MFKLNRMEELKKTKEKFAPKQVPMPDLSNERILLLFEMDYTDESSLMGWLLTFGEKARVLEPAEVREKLLKTAESIAAIYRKEDRG